MIINEIDYFIAIYETGEDGFPEYIAHFEDFYVLNDFIRKNADNETYKVKELSYSFVENIDGEPGSFSWTVPFELTVFSEEQIQQEIEQFIEDEKESAEHFAKVDEWSKQLHYIPQEVDYKAKQHRLADFDYVCPTCLRTVDDCRCEGYPYYLVQIDKLMLPIIRELNEKGYKTTGCCAGHLYEDFLNIYICFAEDYDFDQPFPDGGRYSKVKHCISYTASAEDCDNLADFQRETLYQLSDWVEMLFAVGELDFDDDFEDDND